MEGRRPDRYTRGRTSPSQDRGCSGPHLSAHRASISTAPSRHPQFGALQSGRSFRSSRRTCCSELQRVSDAGIRGLDTLVAMRLERLAMDRRKMLRDLRDLQGDPLVIQAAICRRGGNLHGREHERHHVGERCRRVSSGEGVSAPALKPGEGKLAARVPLVPEVAGPPVESPRRWKLGAEARVVPHPHIAAP